MGQGGFAVLRSASIFSDLGWEVTAIKVSTFGKHALVTLLAGTVLSTMPSAADAQGGMRGGHRGGGQRGADPRGAAQPIPMPPAPTTGAAVVVSDPNAKKILTLRVEGSQRIEPETVLSYTRLRVGIAYNNELLDQAIKDLLASDLFADVSISGVESGNIVLRVRENPIINRVILEGNKRLKEDKITKEIKLKPRQIFTRTAVRQDVARIVELYRRQGRFAAAIEPKMVTLDQNRVDIIFEINEGPKSKVRQINILGNEVFSDKTLRGQMATKEARLTTLLSSNTSYDQDRLAYDQQKMRQFYLTNGYADFRVTSAVAELTPDKKDFIITYVVEEGKRYKFGDVTVDSDIRDFDGKKVAAGLSIKKGDWYDAKKVEDTVDSLNQSAGLVGYAFADTNPEFNRDKDTLTMGINFHIAEAKRSYVERINVTGNTQTQDKVVRREIRVAEGDAFNSFQVKRSQDRINSLGYFQDKFEIKQSQGSAPDRVVLDANVEEKSTGELSLSAGYSSLESFIIQASITQRNFRGKGQELRASVNYSSYSKSVNLGFTEPYLFNKNIAIGGDIFRRDYNAFNYVGDQRQTTYTQVSTGFQIRSGVPLTEYWSLAARYGLTYDEVGLDRQYFNSDGSCNVLAAGSYLCQAIGNRWTSSVGYSLIFDSLNSRLRPTAGQKFSLSQDFAGLGGDVRYVRTRVDATKYKNLGAGFIGSLHVEGGYIFSLEGKKPAGVDKVRITDRFYLGEPDFPGFDIRGVGPRVTRTPYTTDASGKQILVTDRNSIVDDALGGNKYYVGRLEVQIPLGSGARELGLRPSIYVQAGALWGVTKPLATASFPTTIDPVTGRATVLPLVQQALDSQTGKPLFAVPSTDATNGGLTTTCQIGYAAPGGTCVGSSVNTAVTTTTAPFLEQFLGNSAQPRVSVGAGVNWNSPFGPLRIDVAYALMKVKGDDTKLVTFNVGTQF
ncbi:outer membrane protein insertion porin family [Sphingomonas sp. NFR15]|nr:outer membrane protein insertion porin family [Sphingomonas sp. NFR15]